MSVLIRSIEAERARVIAEICPACKAAPNALCTEKIYNSAGIQQRYMNLFHAERIKAAQTIYERNADAMRAIQMRIDQNKHRDNRKK
jgi:hypothetical protein